MNAELQSSQEHSAQQEPLVPSAHSGWYQMQVET